METALESAYRQMLLARIVRLETQLSRPSANNAEPEAELSKTSRNSTKPPSFDGLRRPLQAMLEGVEPTNCEAGRSSRPACSGEEDASASGAGMSGILSSPCSPPGRHRPAPRPRLPRPAARSGHPGPRSERARSGIRLRYRRR